MKAKPVSPDLSLQISPPITAGHELLAGSCFEQSSATESGSSGSEASHELQGCCSPGLMGLAPPASGKLGLHEPSLRLGFDPGVQDHASFGHGQQQLHICGREFKRSSRFGSGGKRSIRAPRMRWTTTLHAHFVHAVELLGGHESMATNENPNRKKFSLFLTGFVDEMEESLFLTEW